MNLWKIFLKLRYKRQKQGKGGIGIWLILLCPLIVQMLSLITIFGWITSSRSLIEIIPHSAPMQFNTALCFFLCSNAFLLSLSRKYDILRILLVICAGAISLISLSQYPLHINFGINTLFIQPFLTNSNHPMSMAPSTALAFISISCSLLLFTFNRRLTPSRGLAISLFASISFALGLVPLFGYLIHLETAYLWIPVETGACFVLLGIATISYIWSRSPQESNWLPIPIFLACITVSLSMSTAVFNKELNKFNQSLEINTQNAVLLTQQTLEDLIQSLNRMAMRWESANKTPDALWYADAKQYLNDYPYLLALEVLDKTLTIQTIESHTNYSIWLGKNLNTDPQRLQLIQKAISTRTPVISENIAIKQGGLGFLCFIPLFIKDQFSGMLVAVFRADDFFNTILTRARFPSINISVYEHGKLVFSNALNPKNSTMEYQHSHTMRYKNTEWVIRLSPDSAAIARGVSHGYLLIWGFGFIMTLILTLCTYFALKANEKSKALANSERSYKMILNGIKDYAIYMLTPIGNVKSWNIAAQKINGYKYDEILGKHFSIFCTPEDIANNIPEKILHIAKTKGKYAGEGIIIRKDGSQFWAKIIIEPLYDPDKKLVGFVNISRDITDSRQLEQERKEVEEANIILMKELENSNSELEHFAHIASHDLQEPIRMINNFGAILLSEKQASLDEEGKEYLHIMTNASIRMQELINDLLNYSRVSKEKIQFQVFDGEAVLKSTLENIKTLIEEQKAIITHDPLPKLYGNPMQIMRLLQNLITNAIKYQPANNKPVIHIGLHDLGHKWQISIKDNGLGIEAEFIKEIFEPFRRLHSWESIAGSGLGLSICKKIAEIHNGELSVISTPGTGSTFYLTLPKYEDLCKNNND